MRDKNKRLRKDSSDMKSLKEYHGVDPQDDYNEPLDAKFMIDVATSDDPYGTPFILFDGDKKYSAYIYFMARGWVHIDENENIEIGRHKIHIQDMAIGKYDSDQVKDGTWLDNLSDIDAKVIDDKFLDGLKTEDGRTLKQACEDILAEIIHTNYATGEYNLEYAEEDGENYIDFFFNTYINDDSLEESANKSETKLTESRDSWTVTDTYEVENSLDEPLKAKYNDREYECYYTLECTGEFDGDEDGCNSAWLVDYKILACELEPLDPKGDGDYIMIEDEDLDTEESQEIMKNLVVYDGDKEMSFFDYMDEVAEGSVDDHEIEDLDYDDWYDSGADDEYDKYRDDNL